MRRFMKPILPLSMLFVSPLHAFNEPERPSNDQLLSDAIDLIQQSDNENALTKIDMVIADFDFRHRNSNKAYFCANGPAQTLMVLLTASQKKQDAEVTHNNWCDAYFLKGFVLINLKRSDEAGLALQKAATMAPLNMHYINEVAEWHKSRGDWQQSIDTFKQAISKVEFAPPSQAAAMHARSLRGIGFGLIEQGRLDEAEAAFQESLKHAPNHSGALGEIDYIKQLRAKKQR